MINKEIDINLLNDIFSEYKDNYNVLLNEFKKIYTYILNDKIVGFLVFSIIYDRCEIDDIFVKSDYRRKHIAESMLNEILNDYDVNNITLEVSSNNESAIKLYEKLGFKKVAMRKNYYKDSDGLLMIKEVR